MSVKMKRSRKKSSAAERSGLSSSAKLREEHDLAYYVHDRVGLMREVFSVLKAKELKSITPECCGKLSNDDLEELCLEELLGISSKRLCSVLDGADPPSATSSSSDSSSSSDDEEQPAPVESAICLDSDASNSVQASKKKKHKKRKKKRRRRSSHASSDSETSQHTATTKDTQHDRTARKQRKLSRKKNKHGAEAAVAILDAEIGVRNTATPANTALPTSSATRNNKKVGGQETRRAATRVGMTVLEIVELQARARAIRAQLVHSNKQAAATTSDPPALDLDDDDVEIKEEAPELVNLVSSSEEEDKPAGEGVHVSQETVPETQTTTKDKDQSKIKKSKQNAEKTTEKDKTNEGLVVDVVDSVTSKENVVIDELKTETEPEKESPDLALVEEDKTVKTAGQKKMTDPKDNSKENHENNGKITEKSPDKATTGQSKDLNDFTVIVEHKQTRKVSIDKNNYVISFSNDGNTPRPNDLERESNTFINTIENPIQKASKKLNSTVTKIVKEKPKEKHLKSIVKKSDSEVNRESNKKEREKREKIEKPRQEKKGKTDSKLEKERHKQSSVIERDKESDNDEITLQLSDSEKMDLLEDLNPRALDRVSDSSEGSSNSGDESEQIDDEEGDDDTDPKLVSGDNDKNNSVPNIKESIRSDGNSNDIVIECNNKEVKNKDTEIANDQITANSKDVTHKNKTINEKDLSLTSETTAPNSVKTSKIPISSVISNLRVEEKVLESNSTKNNTNLENKSLKADSNVKKNEQSNISDESNKDMANNKNGNKDFNDFPTKNQTGQVINENVLEITTIQDIPLLHNCENQEITKQSDVKDTKSDKDKEVTKTTKKKKKWNKRTTPETSDDRAQTKKQTEEIANLEATETRESDARGTDNAASTDERADKTTLETSDNREKTKHVQPECEKNDDPVMSQENILKELVGDGEKGADVGGGSSCGTGARVNRGEASDIEKDTNTNDIEEGEVTSDNLSEGELPSDTDSEIEAQDVTPQTICISDDDGNPKHENQVTASNTVGKKVKKQKKDKKHKKESDKHGNTEDSDKETNASNSSKERRVKKDKKEKKKSKKNQDFHSDTDTNFYKDKVTDTNINKIELSNTNNESNNTIEELVILDRDVYTNTIEGANSSDDNQTNSGNNLSAIHSPLQVNINPNKYKDTTEENANNLENLIEIDTDYEIYEISDDSSECCQGFLSKEPTAEEIEALSAKIDEIDRKEVVTQQEILEHELNTDRNVVIVNDTTININDKEERDEMDINADKSQEVNNRIPLVEVVCDETTDDGQENEQSKQNIIETKDSLITIDINDESSSEDESVEEITDKAIYSAENNPFYSGADELDIENMSWKDRYVESTKVKKVLTTANILNALRKKNLDLKKKLIESKIQKAKELEAKLVETPVKAVETIEIGSIEHYNMLEGSTKYVDPVVAENNEKDAQITSEETEVTEVGAQNAEVKTTTVDQPKAAVSKEMKKDAKQLLKMYKKLLKYNDIYKTKDPMKKSKKKKNKKKDGAPCSNIVTENI